MKTLPLIFLTFLSVSCVKGTLEEVATDDSSSDACKKILSNMMSRYATIFDSNDGLSLSYDDLSQAEIKCLPKQSAVAASVESFLKFAEGANGGLGDDPLIKIASIETFLKYAEGAGLSLAVTDMDSRLLLTSQESYLKYVEAINLKQENIPSYRLSVASVETWLKGAEGIGYTSYASNVIANTENYLKYAEADGQTWDPMKTQADVTPLLVSGYWNATLDTDGAVMAGESIWNNKNTIFESFNVNQTGFSTMLKESITDSFLSKGIVTSKMITSDAEILAWTNKERSYANIESILDRGLIIDRSLFDLLKELPLTSSANIISLLDKGVVVDASLVNASSAFETMVQYQGNNFTGLDRIIDKGAIISSSALGIMYAMLEQGLIDSTDTMLDKGYHIEVRDDGVFIRSIETYLKYAEAVGI